MTLLPYQAVLLRHHPRIQSGEQLNVGVVVFSHEQGKLAFRLLRSRRRVADAFPGRDSIGFTRHLRAIARAFREIGSSGVLDDDSGVIETPSGIEALSDLLPPFHPGFSWSEVRFGLSNSVQQAAHDLYEENVGRYELMETRSRETPAGIWSAARESEGMRDVLHRVRADYSLSTKATDHTFRAGWQNGVVQVADAISLDYARPQRTITQAEVWSGRLHELGREHEFRFTGFISSAPTNKKLLDAYQSAIDILQGNPLVRGLYEVDEADTVARLIQGDLAREDPPNRP